MITQNNPQFNPLFVNIVNYSNWATGIADLARGYALPLQIIDALNPSGSEAMEGPNGIFQIGYYPRQEVQAFVASVAQSGPNLILTWTDPAYDGFRDKLEVQDSNHNHGIVVSTAPGTMTIQPSTSPATLVSTLHFLAGSSVSDLGSASGNLNSTGLKNAYKEPAFRTNYAAVCRESHTVARREKFNSLQHNETVMSWTISEVQMMQRFMKNKVKNWLWSAPGVVTTSEGATNRFEGTRAAIINQGGRFVSSPTLVSVQDIYDDIDFMASNDPSMYQDFVWVIGRKAWGRINTLLGGTNIQYTVSKAVINGNELNFDIPQVTINGVTLKLLVLGLFDDKVTFPKISTIAGAGLKESNTYAMLNLAPIPSAVGGGLVPAVRKFHYASSSLTGGAETLYTYIPGMVAPGSSNATGNKMGQYQMGTSSIDGGQFECLEDGGLDITGDASVWRELSA